MSPSPRRKVEVDKHKNADVELSWGITFLFLLGIFLYSTNSILFVWAKGEDSHFHFILSSVVFLSEIARVIICCVIIICTGAHKHLGMNDLCSVEFVYYAFPALMYALNDQIAFTCLEEMDSATFQTLCSLKIIGTAVCCRIFLKHRISEKQWIGLVALFLGSVFAASASHEQLQEKSSLPHAKHVHYHYSKMKHMMVPDEPSAGSGNSGPDPSNPSFQDGLNTVGDDGEVVSLTDSVESALKDHRFFVTSHGLTLILIYSFLSSVTAAYSEWLLRGKTRRTYQASLGVKFLKVSLWGTFFSLVHCMWDIQSHRAEHPNEAHLLNGFNFWTWMLVLNQCFLGVVLSAIIKELGAVAKLFLLSFAMVISMALAIVSLKIFPDVNYCLSVIAILASLYLYSDGGNFVVKLDSKGNRHAASEGPVISAKRKLDEDGHSGSSHARKMVISRKTIMALLFIMLTVFAGVFSTPLLQSKEAVLKHDKLREMRRNRTKNIRGAKARGHNASIVHRSTHNGPSGPAPFTYSKQTPGGDDHPYNEYHYRLQTKKLSKH